MDCLPASGIGGRKEIVVQPDVKQTIQVGADEYQVDIKKIPYLESFLRFQHHSTQATEPVPSHGDIPFFDIINHGVENGYRHFFRRMPIQLPDYQVLCETLDFLAIDVLGGAKLQDVLQDMRKGKGDWDPEERREIKGLKSVARDAAFKLLYLFLIGEFESDAKDSNMAYNSALFVVSHRAIFRYRTRRMVREALEDRFSISERQRVGLDKWPIKEPEDEKADETTEEESDAGFDSDWSF